MFTFFDGQMRPALTTGINQAISTSLSAVAPELASLLLLFVIIQGMMIMFRQYDLWAGLASIMRAIIISLLVTGGLFATYIQTPFTTTIPNWISTAVGGAPIAVSQFDAIYSATEHFEAGILQQASGLSGIAIRIEVAIMALGCLIFLGLGYVIWLLTMGFINLVVCLGPFVLLAKLFKYTEGIFDRWISKMVGLFLMYLLITILETIVLSAETAFVRQTQANPGAGVDAQVVSMIAMVAFFALSASMLIFIPSVATYVGGGAGFNVMPRMGRWFR